MDRILQLQNNIELTSEQKANCLFLLRLSPSALMYALHPDPLITNSRNSLTAKVKEINEFHTEQFVKSLVGLFVSDLENGQYSAFYYREYGLTGYCIDNQLRLKFRDGEGDKVIENKHRIALAECMGQVVPVALFKDFSEEESGNNENEGGRMC